MGKIQLDHTGSGGGVTLSSDGTWDFKGNNLKKGTAKAKQLNDLSGTQRFAAVVAGGAAGETLVADVEKIGTFGDLFEAGPTELDREISEDSSEDASICSSI